MPIIPTIGRKSFRTRILIMFIYLTLCVLGATMILPFMITLSGAMANNFDYYRFRPVLRCFYSEGDRFVKGLVSYFNSTSDWSGQMRSYFTEMPDHWRNWESIGRDIRGTDAFSSKYLSEGKNEIVRKRAADYAEFASAYPKEDTICPVIDPQAARFLAAEYIRQWKKQNPGNDASSKEIRKQALSLLSKSWGIPYPEFYSVQLQREMRLPLNQQSFFPPEDNKYRDFILLKKKYGEHLFTPGIRSLWKNYLKAHNVNAPYPPVFPACDSADVKIKALWFDFRKEICPASPTVPFAMRAVWRNYLDGEEVRKILGLKSGENFTVDTYNRLAGTSCRKISETPFPVPASDGEGIQKIWRYFVETRYPLRLTTIKVTPELELQFRDFLTQRFKSLENVNRLLNSDYKAWDDFKLTPNRTPSLKPEAVNLFGSVWYDFVKNLPYEYRIIASSEQKYQSFLLGKYGSLENVNKVYGWRLSRIEEAFPPLSDAYLVTFRNNDWGNTLGSLSENFSIIFEYLTHQGRAVQVTIMLILAAVFITLTVNPIAAYGLSRFGVKGIDKVFLFILAPMAFPAMVSAIPAYLLMRDIGLLNTFFALILPSAANGMAIFILKGFFDSLPPELYEAATIDGAKEWQIFTIITLPLMKPILAIQALGAFLIAYTSWEWALIVCQNQDMWTLSVWMYQASQYWQDYPWIVMAGFVIASVPTLIVFLFCQKIILEGIILPSMK
jgi:ABC-type glycerol-3-phosphate transport system permease component